MNNQKPSRKALLLNASNMDKFPIYPYAFIQVPAVARRSGIEVICKDMLGIPAESCRQVVQDLIAQHDPAMILVTLRNTDSYHSWEYESSDLGGSAYFPIERTRELVAVIRASSNLKIALGGFGFSLLPNDLMHYLRPDFGVLGGADDFFKHFEEIISGNHRNVPSLMFFEGEQLISNPRVFYPPLDDAEYTPQAIQAMMEFYAAFPSPGFDGAPVEIMRGCNHSCVFCAEPRAVGGKVRYRDLSAVMKDVEILAEHDITKIYIISSELNPEGNEYILQLADRIRTFNEQQTEGKRITWYGANYLLKFKPEEFKQLYNLGFLGGWYDITSLDDANARAMQTPYRNETLIPHLKTYVKYMQEQERPGNGNAPVTWTIFLGNPATTLATICNTIRVASREGLTQCFDDCYLNKNIRVFDYEKPAQATLAVTYSITPDRERTAYRQILPSFASPPVLLQDFSVEEISKMCDHVAETYLSKKYQQTRGGHNFVEQRVTTETIVRWLETLSDEKGIEVSVDTDQQSKETVDGLLSLCLNAYAELFGVLGFPTSILELEQTTPYDLAVMIYAQWQTEEELNNELFRLTQSHDESIRTLIQFCVQAILYKFNIQINAKYRALFVSGDLPAKDTVAFDERTYNRKIIQNGNHVFELNE